MLHPPQSPVLYEKKVFFAAALLCSIAALAQAPAPYSLATNDAPKATREHRVKIKHHEADGDDDRDGDKEGKPANHGQNLSAFTKSTTLSGADKGAAVSAVARGGRGVDHSPGVASMGSTAHVAAAPRAAAMPLAGMPGRSTATATKRS